MKADRTQTATAVAIWERVVEFQGKLSPTTARALLKLRFSERDGVRMRALSAKAQAGTLTAEEDTELDTFEQLGCLLDILHSKARQALKDRRAAS